MADQNTASKKLYSDLKRLTKSLRKLELAAAEEGDQELSSAAKRARREVARDDAPDQPALIHPDAD